MSTYSFEKHSKATQVRVFDLASETSQLLGEYATFSDPVWVSRHEFVYLVAKDDGTTRLYVIDVESKGQ